MPTMESPHLYESNEFKKNNVNLKVKQGHLFTDDYTDFSSELTNPEISVDLHNFLDETPHQFTVNDNLVQDFQGLNVDKSHLTGALTCLRGVANPGAPQVQAGHMYNPLAYLPQPVHGSSQFERPYHDRIPIKEEPQETSALESNGEYPPCARTAYPTGYGGGLGAYPMTPNPVLGPDNLLKCPLKSPQGILKSPKKPNDKSSDEYRRRRERNNIAVRKSREKAKMRSRETEERVKILTDENRKLQEKCKVLLDQVTAFRSAFSSLNPQYLPEHVQCELRKQMESFHKHQQLSM